MGARFFYRTREKQGETKVKGQTREGERQWGSKVKRAFSLAKHLQEGPAFGRDALISLSLSLSFFIFEALHRWSRKFGKLSSGHRTGKCQFQCQSHRKAIAKHFQTTTQLHSFHMVASEVKVTQSCPTLCYPMDYTVHGILQARILKWVAIPFSRGSSQPRDQSQVSCIAGGFFTSWATGETHASKVMSKILQTRLQQFVNR